MSQKFANIYGNNLSAHMEILFSKDLLLKQSFHEKAPT